MENIINTFLKTAFIIAIFFTGLQGTVWAQAEQTHTVKTGETLFSISKQHDVSVEHLREWNNLSGNELEVGQTLVVGKEQETQPENATTHTVEPRETLFSISKQYRVTISELKRWNNLASNNLEVGQKITIYPPNEGSTRVPENQQQSLVVNTTTRQNTYYTVKSGDTLYDIAEKHNMTVNELKRLNDISSDMIRVGQRLTVRKRTQAAPSVAERADDSTPQGAFVVHSVQSGESLNDILRKFDMSEEEFRSLNPDITTSVQRGQNVTVLLPPTSRHKNPYSVQSSLKNLGETAVSSYDTTQASTTTTSGELYNPDGLTAAHSNIALGNVIFVQNPQNNKGIYVRINDRFTGKGLKLSHAALQALDLPGTGNAKVNMFQDQ